MVPHPIKGYLRPHHCPACHQAPAGVSTWTGGGLVPGGSGVPLSDTAVYGSLVGCCALCRKRIMGEVLYGPIKAGTFQMGFGYGSPAHDVMGYDGFICDACTSALPPETLVEMKQQTLDRLTANRKRWIAQGVKFATWEDLDQVLNGPETP
jgi:hypothetical protein